MIAVNNKLGKFVGLLIIMSCILILSNTQTYAFFYTKFHQYLGVSSASAENLIKYVEIKEKEDKSLVIEIMRDSKYGYRPDVGFEIKGDLSEYIVHINPVKVDKNGVYEIPIVPNINSHQFLELLWKKVSQNKEKVEGVVLVKNFDGKIIDSKKVEIDINYILNRINADIRKGSDVNFNGISSDEVKTEITDLVNTLVSKINWDERNALTKVSSNSDFAMSSYQKSMINTIAPRLIGHLNMLQNKIDVINRERERLNQEIIGLRNKNDEIQASLGKSMEELQEENAKLRKQLDEVQETPVENLEENSEVPDEITQ